MELPESDKEAWGCISVVTPALHTHSPELGPQHWRKKKLGKALAERKTKKGDDSKEEKIQRSKENIYLILRFLPKGTDLARRMTIYFMLIITN